MNFKKLDTNNLSKDQQYMLDLLERYRQNLILIDGCIKGVKNNIEELLEREKINNESKQHFIVNREYTIEIRKREFNNTVVEYNNLIDGLLESGINIPNLKFKEYE